MHINSQVTAPKREINTVFRLLLKDQRQEMWQSPTTFTQQLYVFIRKDGEKYYSKHSTDKERIKIFRCSLQENFYKYWRWKVKKRRWGWGLSDFLFFSDSFCCKSCLRPPMSKLPWQLSENSILLVPSFNFYDKLFLLFYHSFSFIYCKL